MASEPEVASHPTVTLVRGDWIRIIHFLESSTFAKDRQLSRQIRRKIGLPVDPRRTGGGEVTDGE